MQLPHGTHVAVADGNRFVLFRNDGDADLINLVDAASPEVDAGNRGGAKPEPRDLDERGHATGVAALLKAVVAWITGQLRAFDGLADLAPERRRQAGNDNRAIGGGFYQGSYV